MISPLDSPLSAATPIGVREAPGVSPAAVVGSKGGRPSGRQDDAPLYPELETPAEAPEGGDPETSGRGAEGGEESRRDEPVIAAVAAKDADAGGEPGAGGMPFIADETQPTVTANPILVSELRRRAARAYAYGINAVTRDPLALGVIFDNDS